MTFTEFGSYHKDSYDCDEYIATVYSMTSCQYQKVSYFCY